MFIKNDTIYMVAAGCCMGGGMTPSDVESLAQTSSQAAFAPSLNAEMLVGEEEINGAKANHYQVVGPHGSVDIWMSQEGGYVIRLVGPGRSTR